MAINPEQLSARNGLSPHDAAMAMLPNTPGFYTSPEELATQETHMGEATTEKIKRPGLKFPSEILPDTANGTGRYLLNLGNKLGEDPAFDQDRPLCRICHSLLCHGGEAHINDVISETGLPYTEIAYQIAPLETLVFDNTPNGTVIKAPLLKDVLTEYVDNKETHEYLVFIGVPVHSLLEQSEPQSLAAD